MEECEEPVEYSFDTSNFHQEEVDFNEADVTAKENNVVENEAENDNTPPENSTSEADNTQIIHLEEKTKYEAISSNILSHFLDKGIESIIDFKTQEDVQYRTFNLKQAQLKDCLNNIENRNAQLEKNLKEQENNKLTVELSCTQLKEQSNSNSKLVEIIKRKYNQLQKMLEELTNYKAKIIPQANELTNILENCSKVRTMMSEVKRLKLVLREKQKILELERKEIDKQEVEYTSKLKLKEEEVATLVEKLESYRNDREDIKNENEILAVLCEQLIHQENEMQELQDYQKHIFEQIKNELTSSEKDIENFHTYLLKVLADQKDKNVNLNVRNEQRIIKNNEIIGSLDEVTNQNEALKIELENTKSYFKEKYIQINKEKDENLKKVEIVKNELEEAINKNETVAAKKKILEKELKEIHFIIKEGKYENMILKNQWEFENNKLNERKLAYENHNSQNCKRREEQEVFLREFHVYKDKIVELKAKINETLPELAQAKENLKKLKLDSNEQFESTEKQFCLMKNEKDRLITQLTNEQTEKTTELRKKLSQLKEERVMIENETESLIGRVKAKREYVAKLSTEHKNLISKKPIAKSPKEEVSSSFLKYLKDNTPSSTRTLSNRSSSVSNEQEKGPTKTAGILKTPGASSTLSKKVSFQQSMLWEESDGGSQPMTNEEINITNLANLFSNSPPEKL